MGAGAFSVLAVGAERAFLARDVEDAAVRGRRGRGVAEYALGLGAAGAELAGDFFGLVVVRGRGGGCGGVHAGLFIGRRLDTVEQGAGARGLCKVIRVRVVVLGVAVMVVRAAVAERGLLLRGAVEGLHHLRLLLEHLIEGVLLLRRHVRHVRHLHGVGAETAAVLHAVVVGAAGDVGAIRHRARRGGALRRVALELVDAVLPLGSYPVERVLLSSVHRFPKLAQ